LVGLGILKKEQFDKKYKDSTNYYAINARKLIEFGSEVLGRFAAFFSAYVLKKIENIIVNSRDTTYLSRENKSRENGNDNRINDNEVDKSEAAASPKTTTAQDALRVWNETVERNDLMSKPLAKMLVAAMKLKFKTLENWRCFCLLMKENKYYMSSKWRAVLYEILRFSVIDKILSKAGVNVEELKMKYSGKKRPISDLEEQKLREDGRKAAEQHIFDSCDKCGETVEAIDFRKFVLRKHGFEVYNCWMTKVCVREFEDERLEIECGNAFVKNYVENNYLKFFSISAKEKRRKKAEADARQAAKEKAFGEAMRESFG
jgi:hypothetical protein